MIRNISLVLALTAMAAVSGPAAAETQAPEGAVETPVSPRAPRAPRAPRPQRPVAARLLPSGWIGVGLSCGNCGLLPGEHTPIWSFADFPVISYVDGGSPAAEAGLTRGDLLTHVDGVPLVSEEGGRRFGAVQPGQALRLSIRRADGPRVLTVTARERPDPEPAFRLDRLRQELASIQELEDSRLLRTELVKLRERLVQTPALRVVAPQRQRLRYSGTVGNSDVVVRGLGAVIVSKDEATGELIITTRDATIRVKPSERR